MAFMAKILSEYCRLFAQKKAYQGGVMGTPGPPLATLLVYNYSQTTLHWHLLNVQKVENNIIVVQSLKPSVHMYQPFYL